MNSDSSLKMQVGMTFLPKLNSRLYLPLIEACGGIEGFFLESEAALNALYPAFHLKKDLFNRKQALALAEKELEYIDRLNIQLCSIEHHRYPFLLHQCEDAPLVFYYKGLLYPDERTYIAIVGTRKASGHCRLRVESIIGELHRICPSLITVSGLAFGIDITAHQASLKYDIPTYAVLGHGLHTLYPSSHKNIAEKLLAQGGALISEFPCLSPILPVNFLQRNRIIAGLCQATFIAESAVKGGAMATARMAQSYSRDVIALPGRPEDKMSSGCNLLIKQNIAALIENGEDIARIMGLDIPSQTTEEKKTELFSNISSGKSIIIKLLTEQGGMNIDNLNIATRIPVPELSAWLTELELEEKILSLPGKNYIIK